MVGSNTKITTNISSTILSRNTYTQIGFNSWGTTAVKIYNSTLRNSRGLPSLHILGIGALFQLGADGPNSNLMNVHLTQTHIEGNDIGINIQGEHSSYEATVTETTIKQNRHGILIGSFSYQTNMNGSITIRGTSFEQNTGISLGVGILRPDSPKTSDIILSSVKFFNNTNPTPNAGVVQVDRSINLSIEDSCVFKANQGTPVQALATTVTLSGVVTFEDNIAFRGGAISLSYSMLRLQSSEERNVNITVVNNTATNAGGGIYINRSMNIDPATASSCFYGLEGLLLDDLLNSIINVTLVFEDNAATNGVLIYMEERQTVYVV